MTAERIDGRVLLAGFAEGEVLALNEPLSLWGGLDPATGVIIDRQHPQAGQSVAGKIVAMPGSRGSSGTPGVLGEALRCGVGPRALVLTKGDFNLVAGAMVAETLYGTVCPIVVVEPDVLNALATGSMVSVGE